MEDKKEKKEEERWCEIKNKRLINRKRTKREEKGSMEPEGG